MRKVLGNTRERKDGRFKKRRLLDPTWLTPRVGNAHICSNIHNAQLGYREAFIE
jgi:hypothetical protein